MTKKLVFATGNPNKVAEVNEVLAHADLNGFDVVTMREIGQTEDLPETTETVAGNSLEKAQFLHQKFGVDCFSEDTGLEIDALAGAPGVHTAHYGGTRDAHQNMDLVLSQLQNVERRSARSARFRTVITLILDGKTHIFEAICEGTIRTAKAGEGGFGYDPIFEPYGFDRTFAQLDNATKSTISHRGKATDKMIQFLKSYLKNQSI